MSDLKYTYVISLGQTVLGEGYKDAAYSSAGRLAVDQPLLWDSRKEAEAYGRRILANWTAASPVAAKSLASADVSANACIFRESGKKDWLGFEIPNYWECVQERFEGEHALQQEIEK